MFSLKCGLPLAAESRPILWPPDVKSWLIWKDPDAGKDWGQEEKETTEDEIDGWMASPTRMMWVWVNSESWWWTGRPDVLQFMGSQRVGHDWVTELTDWLTEVPNLWDTIHFIFSCSVIIKFSLAPFVSRVKQYNKMKGGISSSIHLPTSAHSTKIWVATFQSLFHYNFSIISIS